MVLFMCTQCVSCTFGRGGGAGGGGGWQGYLDALCLHVWVEGLKRMYLVVGMHP